MSKLTLYHFTSKFHVRKCQEEGLTLGKIPLSVDPPKLISGYQWLTRNDSFLQEWNEASSLPYDRTEFRLKIEIPRKHRKKLLQWIDAGKKIVPRQAFEILSMFRDPENWYLFKGVVLPKWIKDVRMKQ